MLNPIPANRQRNDRPVPELALMAHLMRRAGFGATLEELERRCDQGYQETVEELLHPERAAPLEEDILRRYLVDQNSLMLIESCQAYWLYRIINTGAPLEEKLSLFWHGLFATAYGKLNHAKAVVNQTNIFRRHGLGSFRTLLLEVSRDPAMIFWLDNKDNRRGAPNENYGRELLELFSMGIGNYTEDDVKACAGAFTGWTIANAQYMSVRAARDSVWPHGRLDWQFVYRPEVHDDCPRTFLGQTGRLNGEDIIDIICDQPATAWFVASKLYQFFVSDVPDEVAIQLLAGEYRRTSGDIRSVLRTLFQSDFFAAGGVRLAKVKSPAELVGGTARLAGGHRYPEWRIVNLAMDVNFMGQEILNPPTVEGWHTGREWIDTGNLVERINATALEMGAVAQLGVRSIIDRLRSNARVLSPEVFVDICMHAMGQFESSVTTRDQLVRYASKLGDLRFDRQASLACSEQRVSEMLQLIVATPEYQLA
jgi:uncharacterized protein (DUF1800 family)